jgi:[ribosomal protein S18]-alanine N-acetyltransferase
VRAAVAVRLAIAEDLGDVVALERSVPEAPHWAESEYVEILRRFDEVGGVRRALFVAERDGEVVGFAVGKVVQAVQLGELESVAVAPDARKMGVGKALCEAVIVWCEEQAVASVELEVRSASDGARRLYERFGFVVEGVRTHYYSKPDDDAVLMRLKLNHCG